MSTVHVSDILMVLKNSRLKSCERIYTIDFFSFSADQISRYISLTTLNRKFIENVLHMFCLGQSW